MPARKSVEITPASAVKGAVGVHGSMLPPVIMRCCALCAFALAVICGIAADNPASTVLSRALVAMFAALPVGWGVGYVASRVVHEQVLRRQEAIPAPRVESDLSAKSASKDALAT